MSASDTSQSKAPLTVEVNIRVAICTVGVLPASSLGEHVRYRFSWLYRLLAPLQSSPCSRLAHQTEKFGRLLDYQGRSSSCGQSASFVDVHVEGKSSLDTGIDNTFVENRKYSGKDQSITLVLAFGHFQSGQSR